MDLHFSENDGINRYNEFVYDDNIDDNKNANLKIIDTNLGNNLYYTPLENKLNQQNSIFNATIKPKQKPKLTYDDMLNSMNVTVVNGILRFGIDNNKIKNTNEVSNEEKYNMEYKTSISNETKKTNQINNQKEKPRILPVKGTNPIQPPQQNQPLDPNVKNSWIYNKYFKNFKDSSEEINQERPLTKKEWEEKIIRDYLERKRAQKLASKVKSTKLLFSNHNQAIYSNQANNLNKLFRF
jgi:hypothetical protein